MKERLVNMLGSWMYFWESSKLESTAVVFEHCAMHFRGQVVDLQPLLPCSLASLSIPIMGITSLKLVERAMYSASVVDNAVMVCILDAQVMGTPAKQTIQPERNLDVIGSTWASF